MNAVTAQESSAMSLRPASQFDLSPRSFEQALTFSEYLANSDMVPKDFKGKPANCLIAMQWGAELGLKPMQAIQNIAIINGRPSLWGDAMLALVLSSPLCEYVTEDWLTDGTAICRAKRRGSPEQSRTFSDADAQLAGLKGKQGPWTTGPKRMRQLRARAFALRDVFTDVLRGLAMAEEIMDYPSEPKSMGAADVVQQPVQALPATWPDDKLDEREAKCKEWAAAGKSADDAIAFFATKGTLTDAQKSRIRGWMSPAETINNAKE